MLNNVTWANYWIVIGIILFLYYAGIFFGYYSIEVKQILSGKSKLTFNSQISNDFAGISSQQDFLSEINQFKQEIRMKLKEAGEKNLIKQELICSLQLIFKEYSTIKDVTFEASINDYILNECSNYCSIHLKEEEVKTLWVN
jgi:hypothetical protein